MIKYIIGVLGSALAVVAVLFTNERGKRALAEQDAEQAHNELKEAMLKDDVEKAVQSVKEDQVNVEVDNNDGRPGIGGELRDK